MRQSPEPVHLPAYAAAPPDHDPRHTWPIGFSSLIGRCSLTLEDVNPESDSVRYLYIFLLPDTGRWSSESDELFGFYCVTDLINDPVRPTIGCVTRGLGR